MSVKMVNSLFAVISDVASSLLLARYSCKRRSFAI